MIIDEQVEIVRDIARGYEGLTELTKLPASLRPRSPCKAVDDIRAIAIAFVLNELIERTIQEQRHIGVELKQKLSIPRHMISPFEGIPSIEYDPMELGPGSF